MMFRKRNTCFVIMFMFNVGSSNEGVVIGVYLGQHRHLLLSLPGFTSASLTVIGVVGNPPIPWIEPIHPEDQTHSSRGSNPFIPRIEPIHPEDRTHSSRGLTYPSRAGVGNLNQSINQKV